MMSQKKQILVRKLCLLTNFSLSNYSLISILINNVRNTSAKIILRLEPWFIAPSQKEKIQIYIHISVAWMTINIHILTPLLSL